MACRMCGCTLTIIMMQGGPHAARQSPLSFCMTLCLRWGGAPPGSLDTGGGGDTHAVEPPAQVPGGWAAQRWGGRAMLVASFVLWSTASLLTPQVLRAS